MEITSTKPHTTGRMMAVLGTVALFVITAFIVIVPTEESDAFVESYNYMTLSTSSSESLHFTVYAQDGDEWVEGAEVELRWETSSGSHTLFPWYNYKTSEYGNVEWWMSTNENELIKFMDLFISVGSWEKFGLGTGTSNSTLHQNFDFRFSDTNSVCILDNPEDVYDFWVRYTINTTVSFNMNGGSGNINPLSNTETTDDFSIYETVRMTLPSDVPSRNGYEFRGWSTTSSGDAVYQPGQSITVNKGFDLELFAVWEENAATVTFMSNGSVYETVSVPIGQTVTAPTDPTLYGYTFQGWYTDNLLTMPYSFTDVVTGDITLYAKWEGDLEFTTEPTAEMNVTPVEGQPGTVLFDASGSSDYKTLLWDFGDGSEPSTNTYVTHYYSEPGTYTATLTVYNDYGSNTVTYTIEVPSIEHEEDNEWTLIVVITVTAIVAGALILRKLL